MDLIERQAAIEALEHNKTFALGASAWLGGGSMLGYSAVHRRLIEAIKSLPSAAQKKGKWEFIGGYGYQYRCSACLTCAEHRTKFCPNCGAKMEAN